MTEPLATHHAPRTTHKTDWLLIGVLVALVLPLRLWLICNTEVTARDSIGYIRYALQFEQKPWAKVLQQNHQHPGYPVLVWLTSLPIRAMEDATTAANMTLSAQLVSLVASLVLLVPMYWLGRQFFDRPVSFFATLLYQYLPISAQHLSDGISEPLYLVFLVMGLLQMVHGIRNRSVWRCALGGVFAGLAYLTRPEGALILPALGLMLIVMQIRPTWRCSWWRCGGCGSAAVFSAIAVGCTYAIVIGGLTNKPAPLVAMGFAERAEMKRPVDIAGPLSLFAATIPPTDNKLLSLGRSVWALGEEINQGFHYLAGVPALLGFVWSFAGLRRQPAFWALMAYIAIHGLILISLAMRVYYISDRHVMILVIGGCFFAVVALSELPRRILAWRKPVSQAPTETTGWLRSAPLWSAVLFVALLGACLPKATQRLHGNRAGNHAAGIWLAEHLHEGDVVMDDHAWSMFHAGLVFEEGREPKLPRDLEATCYIVITRSRDPRAQPQSQVIGVEFNPDGTAKSLRTVPIAKDAKTVYTWPPKAEADKVRVLIYAQRRDNDIHPWKKNP